TAVPSPLPWATVVGQAYRLAASPTAPDLHQASISFSYLGSEVPPGEEVWLRVYFWNGSKWTPLPTKLNRDQNVASAPAQGTGVYTLMSSIEIALHGPGLNLFGYPVPGTRPIRTALAAIQGAYTIVYEYDPTRPQSQWKVFDVNQPDARNTLKE